MTDLTNAAMLEEECVPLEELFDGPSGAASIGRLISTTGPGREVLLRRIGYETAEALAMDVRAARLVAHPSVLKLLGLSQQPHSTSLYLVSEFIVGASLLQIVEASRLRGRPLPGSVNLKVVHDALVAAFEVRHLLRETSHWRVGRTLFHDTIWVADFGATLLSEVGVSQRLHLPADAVSVESDLDLDGDVFAAGAALRCLFSDAEGQLAPPAAHREAVISLLGRSQEATADRFKDPHEMARAIAALPQDLVAGESDVRDQVHELMRPTLELQHARLGLGTLLGRFDAAADAATQVFSASELVKRSERPTQRPPVIAPVAGAGRASIPMPEMSSATLDTAAPPQVFRGAASDFASLAGETTQIFVPVFGAHGPEQTQLVNDRVPAAGAAEWNQHVPDAEAPLSAHAHPNLQRAPRRSKLAILLMVAIIAAIVLLWWWHTVS